ncbi:MAG: tetratricopeptide repeat protein, partial [Bacteroidales bacterium]|nr:tetratricopeptide repeat protein [Candidatus Scybalousia scybalohippi]
MEREEKYTILRDLTEQESYTEALKQVDAFLEQDKQDDMLWYLRGNIFKKQEQWKQAIDSYTEAISINPKNPATTMRRICIDILNFYDKT